MLSPLLHSLFKFSDNMTVVGLITSDDETAYREEVSDLAVWCRDNKLSLNVADRGLQENAGVSTPPSTLTGL